ncbi:MAG TPA: dsDNA nuclease domain-containing protein, partial [Desulfobacterales bacterium]|nr:dsDNA nuclease domain-containing protein [Desulfobacterales bacterium]
METDLSSIHELPPIETGGIEARKGFSFQDHLAVSFLLDMYENESLEQVWCETQDDITLIWNIDGNESVEFVQAKSSNLNQLWSVAELWK